MLDRKTITIKEAAELTMHSVRRVKRAIENKRLAGSLVAYGSLGEGGGTTTDVDAMEWMRSGAPDEPIKIKRRVNK